MDLLCQRCGEPWDMDYVQYEMAATERVKFHEGEGCPACANREVHLSERQRFAVDAQVAMRVLLGDDLDGLAAEMEDLGLT